MKKLPRSEGMLAFLSTVAGAPQVFLRVIDIFQFLHVLFQGRDYLVDLKRGSLVSAQVGA